MPSDQAPRRPHRHRRPRPGPDPCPTPFGARYETDPYPDLRFPALHPARLTAIARLWGLSPGAQLREGLRMLMRMEQERLALPDGGLACAQATLTVLETGSRGLSLPHADLLRLQLQGLRIKPPGVLRHDELGPVFEPLYLLEVAQLARAHGLGYVADNDLLADCLDCYPQPCREALATPGMDRFRALQYADFLVNRAVRHSLLCRAEAAGAVRQAPDPMQLPRLHLRSYLQPAGSTARREGEGCGEPQIFRTRRDAPTDAPRAAPLSEDPDAAASPPATPSPVPKGPCWYP